MIFLIFLLHYFESFIYFKIGTFTEKQYIFVLCRQLSGMYTGNEASLNDQYVDRNSIRLIIKDTKQTEFFN